MPSSPSENIFSKNKESFLIRKYSAISDFAIRSPVGSEHVLVMCSDVSPRGVCEDPYSFIHFHTCFSSQQGRGAAALGGGLEIAKGQQQSQIVSLAPHQDRTQHSRRCSYATWSLDDLWAAFPHIHTSIHTKCGTLN